MLLITLLQYNVVLSPLKQVNNIALRNTMTLISESLH